MAGNIAASKSPALSEPKASEAIPTAIGPAAAPMFPVKDSAANMGVPLPGKLRAARLTVPGQNIPAENPHKPNPKNDTAGTVGSAAKT